MSDLLVRVGGMDFRGYGDSDEYGYWIEKGGWDGWETAPSASDEDTARPLAHGTTNGPQYLDAREVVQSGFFRARSVDELGKMALNLSRLLADGGTEKVSVRQNGLWLSATARRGITQPKIVTESDGYLHVGEYEITYRMPDPRKYGTSLNEVPTRELGVPLAIGHKGNFDAFPVYEFLDPPSSYTVTSEFGTLTVSGVPAGGKHRVDSRTGRVTRDGVAVGSVRGRLWTIPPGRTIDHILSIPGWVITPDTYI